mmetsp:Transcript_34791/g.49382  ORF Transcript_34791/g.49382 Transcript_34791/m.49382 type:complete len:207 (+) Transcript_34791:240-860(+)
MERNRSNKDTTITIIITITTTTIIITIITILIVVEEATIMVAAEAIIVAEEEVEDAATITEVDTEEVDTDTVHDGTEEEVDIIVILTAMASTIPQDTMIITTTIIATHLVSTTPIITMLDTLKKRPGKISMNPLAFEKETYRHVLSWVVALTTQDQIKILVPWRSSLKPTTRNCINSKVFKALLHSILLTPPRPMTHRHRHLSHHL